MKNQYCLRAILLAFFFLNSVAPLLAGEVEKKSVHLGPPSLPVLSVRKGMMKDTVVITLDYPSNHSVVLESSIGLPSVDSRRRWVTVLPIDEIVILATFQPNRTIYIIRSDPRKGNQIYRARMLN